MQVSYGSQAFGAPGRVVGFCHHDVGGIMMPADQLSGSSTTLSVVRLHSVSCFVVPLGTVILLHQLSSLICVTNDHSMNVYRVHKACLVTPAAA